MDRLATKYPSVCPGVVAFRAKNPDASIDITDHGIDADPQHPDALWARVEAAVERAC
jgi:hypothetical protein